MATTAIVYALIGRDRASGVFRQVGRSANRLASTSSKVGAAIKASLAVGAIGIAGLGAASIKAAGDFEKNMNRVEALSGATGKQLVKLRNQAKDLGKTTQYGAAQSADAMAQLATAGLDVNQIYGAMPSVLSLASSEQLNLTRAAEITTNVLTGYGMTIKEIPHAVDAMVKASVKANTSVDDLGEAFKYSGPIAHQAGLQFEEAVAATALMGNAGIKASMAGTALRGAVTRLLAPTKKITNTLKELGVNVATSDGKLRPLTSIVDQLAKKGATTGQIMTIFGQRAGPGMAALIQQGSTKLAGLTKELEESGGTADRIAKIQMKGWRGEVIRLKNAWEGLMIEVGDTGLLTGATKALSGVTLGVREAAEWVNTEGIPAAKRFGTAVGDMIPVEKIKSGFSQAKSLVGDFFSGLKGPEKKAPTPLLKPLPASMQRAPVAPTVALPKTPPSDAKKLGEQIRGAVSGGIEGVDWSKVGEALGGALGKSFQWLAKNGGKLGKQLIDALSSLDWVDVGKQVGSQAFGFMIGFVSSFGQDLFKPEFWKKHFWDTLIAALSFIGIGKLAGPLAKVFSKIPILRMFSPMLRGVNKLTAPFSKAIGKVIKFFGSSLWKGIAKVFPTAAGVLEREAGLLTTRLGVWGLELLAKGRSAITFLGSGIRSGVGWVVAKIGEVIALTLKPFAKAGGWLLSKGAAVARGFGTGLLTAARGAGGLAKRVIIDPTVGAFRTAGSWLLSKGSAIVSGFKSGAVSAARGIGAWGRRWIITPVVGAFRTAGTWLLSKGTAIVSGFKSGAVSTARGIGGWAKRTIVTPVTSTFGKAGSWLVSKGTALISGLKSGIVSGVKGIGGWLKKTLIDPIVNRVKSYFGIHSPSTVFAGIGGNLVAGLFKGLATTSGTAIAKTIFGDMPSALGAIVGKGLVSISSLPGKAIKALGGLGSKVLGFFGLGGGGGSGGSNRWAPLVSSVLQMLGAPATALGPVLKRIQMESGGNPKAINNWDINAKNGDPSRGLMQTIGSTFNAYAGPFRGRGIYDPLANIYAGVNYAMHRYGGNWVSVMTRPGGYAEGTRGGLAPFGQTAWVGEKGPELMQVTSRGTRIFSNEDSMALAAQGGIKLPGYASGTIQNASDRSRTARSKVEAAKDAVARARRRHKGLAAAQKRLQAAEKELAAAKLSLRNAQRSAKTSISNTIKTGLLKTLQTGTSSKIASTVKSLATKLLNAGYDKTAASIQKKGSKLQGLADKRTSIQNQIKAANQYATDQAGNITEFLGISGTSATSLDQLIAQMTSQQKTASSFVALTRSLKARGASKDLLEELSEAGPGSQLAAILGDRSVATQDITKLNSLIKSGNSLATSFGKDMADLMFDSGKDAGRGFLAGLKSQEKELGKQINKLASDLVNQIKKALKIKSPSVVMRDQVGKNVALGVARGIDAHAPSVLTSAQRMANAAAGVSTRRVVIPSPASTTSLQQAAAVRELAAAVQASGSSDGGQFTGELVLDSGELLGVIRGTVRPMIQASEKAQAYRAKVGRPR
ncbi:phage tail tape measure protein [Streptomyces sp. NPDC091281]|uniref:phage tail tape measure protein n=1 Tax=Streptomyces sp. NPDC091281 TaxID=3365985 RepID=UPI0037F88569